MCARPNTISKMNPRSCRRRMTMMAPAPACQTLVPSQSTTPETAMSRPHKIMNPSATA